MMLIVCDKCGKGMKQFDWSPVRFPYFKIEKVFNLTMKVTYNLCQDCQKKFEEWLRENKDDKEKELEMWSLMS